MDRPSANDRSNQPSELDELRASLRAKSAQVEELREAAERYRALLDSLDEGFCVIQVLFDEKGQACDYRFLDVNAAFEAQTGLRNAVGRRVRALAPEHEEFWFRIYGDIAKTGRARRFENPARALGRYYEVSAFRVGAPEEHKVGILFKDVAERRRVQQALHESEARHAFLLALSDALRAVADPAEVKAVTANLLGTYLGVSRALYGEVTPDRTLRVEADYRTEDVPSFVGEYPMERMSAAFMGELLSGRPLVETNTATSSLLSPEQREGCIRLHIFAYVLVPFLKDGELVALLAVHQNEPREWKQSELTLLEDVAERSWANVQRARAESELLQANRELRQADQQKDEFLAMLAHELRNPLAAIAYVLRYLLETGGDAEQLRPRLQVLQRQTRSLRTIVDELLDVSRMTRGLVTLHREALDFAALVARCADGMRHPAGEKRQTLELELPAQPLLVSGDAVRLEQVVVNLLSNAIKYTGEAGEIRVSVQARDGRALLQVRDNGIGLRPDMLPRVFDLFTQAERDLARESGGLGIGLTIVKRLVEMHGGTVAAHSAGLQQGSLFEVELPLLDDPPLSASPRQEAAPFVARRVLLVDDSRDVAEALGVLLRLAGHEVRVAYDGPDALRQAADFLPEVVLLDIGMPGMDGYQLAARLRELPGLEHARLAALTGYDPRGDLRTRSEASLDAHFIKPTDLDALLAFICGG